MFEKREIALTHKTALQPPGLSLASSYPLQNIRVQLQAQPGLTSEVVSDPSRVTKCDQTLITTVFNVHFAWLCTRVVRKLRCSLE